MNRETENLLFGVGCLLAAGEDVGAFRTQRDHFPIIIIKFDL